jgi:cell division protein FtsL
MFVASQASLGKMNKKGFSTVEKIVVTILAIILVITLLFFLGSKVNAILP